MRILLIDANATLQISRVFLHCFGTHDCTSSYVVEVCMGMGISIPMGCPWDSHKNGSSFLATNGNENGNSSNGNGNSIFYR